jgi:hypothetical protein
MFEEKNVNILKEKDQFLVEQTTVKEVVTKALLSVSVLEQEKKSQSRLKWGSSLRPFNSFKQG